MKKPGPKEQERRRLRENSSTRMTKPEREKIAAAVPLDPAPPAFGPDVAVQLVLDMRAKNAARQKRYRDRKKQPQGLTP